MKIYLIGVLASILAAFLIFVEDNKFMSSKLLLKPGESVSKLMLRKRKVTEGQSNILVNKILNSYNTMHVSYKAMTVNNNTSITVDTAVFGVNDNSKDTKTIFTVVPIAKNYSILIKFIGNLDKNCSFDCPLSIKASFELRNDIHSQIVDPSICSHKGCYFLGLAEYSYSIKDSGSNYQTKLPKTLNNINLEEAFEKMFSRSLAIEGHFPLSGSSYGNYDGYTFDIMDESEDFPGMVDFIISHLSCKY